MAGIEDLVDDLERSYREAQERLSDPSVYNDHREAAEVGRRLKELEGPYRLAQEGHAPERLETSATITFVPGTGITKSVLTVTATVPGLDEEAFRREAEAAKDGCPVSSALAGNVELELEATLR